MESRCIRRRAPKVRMGEEGWSEGRAVVGAPFGVPNSPTPRTALGEAGEVDEGRREVHG